MLGTKLREAEAGGQHEIAAQIIRLLALTGRRRSELTKLRWSEVDIESSCLRLEDSEDGKSVRPVGLPVIECLQQQKVSAARTDVFPADTVAGYIQGLLDGAHYKLTTDALGHSSRKPALARFLAAAVGEGESGIDASGESIAA